MHSANSTTPQERQACILACEHVADHLRDRLDEICELASNFSGATSTGLVLIDVKQVVHARAHGPLAKTLVSFGRLHAEALQCPSGLVVNSPQASCTSRGGKHSQTIRHFAAVPLICRHGHTIGLLMVADQAGQAMPEPILHVLQRLASVAVGLFEVSDVAAQVLVDIDRGLRESQRHLENVVAAAPVLIFAVDDQGIITRFQGPAMHSLQINPDAAIGHVASQFFAEYPDIIRMLSNSFAGIGGTEQVQVGDRTFLASFSTVEAESVHGREVYALLLDVSERQELEAKLSLAEKQETVGLLASGIAHEINSPMQFIGDNVDFLVRSFGKFDRLLSRMMLMLEHSGSNDFEEDKRALADIANTIRLPYLVEQIPLALMQTQEGVDRVTAISTSMREMSHRGNEEFAETDINRAITTSLAVSRGEYKYVADVELDLDKQLPMVLCQPWEIKQVIVNLIVNASHAIGDCIAAGRYERGVLTIRSSVDGNDVLIAVEDNGPGIPDELQKTVFQPFFTTKPAGKGTGQGLALAVSVIEAKHKGVLELYSWPGEGTTFIIRLPIGMQQATVNTAA